MPDYVSRAEILIRKPRAEVWKVVTSTGSNPEIMFGAEIGCDWHVGSPITWTGVFHGQPYEDKGVILKVEEPRLLSYTHFSAMSGLEDVPENYHTLVYTLAEAAEGTRVTLTQDKNPTPEAAAHSEQNWMLMLKSLRSVAEDALVDD